MLKFMKNKILIPLLITGILAAFFSFKYSRANSASQQDRRKLVMETVMKTIQGGHFSPRPLDDTFSSRVYRKMVSTLDYEKVFFTKADIAKLKAYEFQIDDEIKQGSTEFFDSLEAIYKRRLVESEKYYPEILKTPFSYTSNESIQLNPDKVEYAADASEISDRWRQNLKYRALVKYVDLKKEQDKKKENKDSVNAKLKTDAELELQAREDVKKLYQRLFKQKKKTKNDEYFTWFMNVITENEDPHTSYFPPIEKKAFDEAMSGSFFGIGAQLREDFEQGKIFVTSIVTGSASWKQGELKGGDEIMKVAQGDKAPVDVQGMEINDVVKLIRGEKGTEVRLTVKKADGAVKVVPIKRDVVQLEDTYAKSAIIKDKSGLIGYIYLPEFYADFNHTSGRTCSSDIAAEVKKLKDAGVSGIILDLRNNGGGSLGDVVDMSGLFVGKGPVVQVKSNHSAPNVLRAQPNNDSPSYTGPLVIMVNQNSASASEILAAAMQDYKRAVIVGSTTYGKGTVQKMVSLDDMVDPMARLHMMSDTAGGQSGSIGSLKLTMEKFYRINGGSTQLKGVTPNIQLPDASDAYDDDDMGSGERRNKSALPWDEVPAANYRTTNSVPNMSELVRKSESRVNSNPNFKQISENAKFIKMKKENNIASLNEQQYKKDQEEINALSKKTEELEKKNTPLDMTNPMADMSRINADSSSVAKNKEWLKNLGKDIYLSEAVNILNDMPKSGMRVNIGTGMK
jgi:carboxyl-terminal processing protease